MRKNLETKLLYDFEDNDKKNKWLDSDQPMGVLRKFIHRIHKKHGKTKNPPVVVAGRGEPSRRGLLSYSKGASKILFARHQRTRRVAIHEYTHIKGPINHGEYFVQEYVKLLVEYGRYNKKKLIKRLNDAGIFI